MVIVFVVRVELVVAPVVELPAVEDVVTLVV